MSIYRPTQQTQQALRLQKTAIIVRLRENTRLKIVSLGAAVCLYVFVQSDHNPTITREFVADVKYQQLPTDTDVDTTQRNIAFTVSGPKLIVDRIKDGDIRAEANLRDRPLNKPQTLTALMPVIHKLTADQISQLNIEQTGGPFKFRLVPLVTRAKTVSIHLKPSPAGYHYGKPLIQPGEVILSGWAERVNMANRVSVDYTVDESGRIRGMFAVVLRDQDDNLVDNVVAMPSLVSVNVPLLPDPQSRFVTISPDIRQMPQPPWTLEDAVVKPGRVKISGNAEAVNRLFTLLTEHISLRDETQSREIEVGLRIPDGVIVQDTQGNPVHKVKVRVSIRKTVTPPARNATDPPDLPPVNPNG
jgi:YbbR domain-containing protein